ncbi:MAG: amino acid ABC transporter substrate-binding protein [Anaerolineae bacterium]|nr:amino acid ABC transporter substrate-binding protein [Anaerolineae bacterium]
MKYLHVLGVALVLLMSAVACQPSDALDRIQEAGVLRVAMDPSLEPFEFVDGNGQPVGFDVDLAKQIGARIGVEIQFVTTSYDGLYDALTAQKADIIISALYPDPARMDGFAFSAPYFQAGDMLIVRESSAINGVNDLAGKQVMVVYGTEAHLIAEQWSETLSPPATLLPGDAPETIIAVLASGYADAVLVDNISAQIHTAKVPGLRIVGSPVNDNPYVIAARAEDKALIDAIGKIIQEMHQDGTIEQLFQRWLSQK